MSFNKSLRVATFIFAGAFALLSRPAGAHAWSGWQDFAQTSENAIAESAEPENSEMQSDRDQEQRDREQEKREREQEQRDREQEKKDRDQERLDRLEELYDNGREALDDEKYEQARDKFAALAKANGPQTDAALYWQAYAAQRLGQREAALAALADLKARFPQSRWQRDAGALEIEVRQGTGQPSRPELQGDEELKMLAIQGLMNSDPERAMPMIEKVLQGPASPKEKSRAMFLLAQSGSPQGREIIGRIARGQSNPELQKKAVEYLAIFGGPEARKTMAEIYASTADPALKRSILRSYMIGGDKERLFAAAKSEKDPALRREAIRQLGLVHGEQELEQLYRTENTPEIRREILQAFFLAGDVTKMLEAAKNEKDPELRRAAVRNLGLVRSDDSGKALATIYANETDRGIREEVLNAYFLQGNASAIVAIAKAEKDLGLKKKAVEKLSLMRSKEASDYMMELLQK
ncbi:MAG TPA: HEAT repeat domain-containing protein [Verrucomicrobiae bacterium]|nr:HEAT repeat domain-containing protein [Verrucomicrobiae bacterium]